MAIITSVPAIGSIVKGSPATFTLSKAQLLLVPSVAGSTYYSDSGNWKAVVLNYMSDPLNQPEVVGFDATQPTPTGIFDVVLSALDVFNIQSISIIDFQGGVFTVPRSELTVAEFDVDMGTPPPSYVTYNNLFDGGATDVNGKVYKGSGGGEPLAVSNTSVGQFAGNFNISFKISNVDTFGVIVGLSSSNSAAPAIKVQASSGNLIFRDSNGVPIALGSYATSGDVVIKMVFNAQTIQILKDDVEILAPQALFAAYGPTQALYPSAIAAIYAGFSSGISSTTDIVKETYTN